MCFLGRRGKMRPTFALAWWLAAGWCAFVCNCKRQEGPTARHSSVTFDQHNLALKGRGLCVDSLQVPVVDQDFLFAGFSSRHM
jgi:hypothetical protein